MDLAVEDQPRKSHRPIAFGSVEVEAMARKLDTLTGALISYGIDLRGCYHRSVYFIDKTLRGAAPGDLPIEFPAKFPL
jgi:hypothetical protein